MKKLIAQTLATVMLLALCACGGGNAGGSSDVSYDIPEGKVIPDDAVLDITIASHASWPYDENWKVWEYIKEAIGGTINVNAIPSSDFGTKFTLVMATPDSLPDVFGFMGKPGKFSDYCEQGAFVALDDYEEFLPDYNEFWNSRPEDEQWMRDTRKGIDGKVYYTPIYGMERSKNIRSWLYRKDVFEKHNLKTPETIDELYTVSKQLKAFYPDSYPFCLRSGLANINVMGPSWKPYFHYGAYYDFVNEKWCY
ncbi:MAG: extracellular solute-binding protein, partial [Oscillospiraceae bacterium]|nr:extracellular solute-binding protein [Oscillospiraceae bacterium]